MCTGLHNEVIKLVECSQQHLLKKVHPNQSGTFSDQGVPMDISKACAEGKCFKCGQPWPCKKHFRPHQHQVHIMVFRGVTIKYTSADDLAKSIQKVKQDKGFVARQ
ncbi:hypothetical protein HD554DRAFT_2037726 [Boletus coccyginus]|nr:hypothetical protein HD554DRAFT_2037726 [Boletus coccyginus]